MRHAAALPDQSETLLKYQSLEFHDAIYSYSLTNTPHPHFAVSGSGNAEQAELVMVMGAGRIAQTFLLKKGISDIEGRLTFYTASSGLDITPGHQSQTPESLEKALGHKLDSVMVQRCWSCHTTGAVNSHIFQPYGATPGLTCEACHGPGAKHVADMNAERYDRAATTIVNPERLSPSDSVDFCGACHRTFADVAVDMPSISAPDSLRFQPYRLEKSRCWGGQGDSRLTCVACHDPHQPLVLESMNGNKSNASAYDAKCLACHALKGQASARKKPACKVAVARCVSCHMPKYQVTSTHGTFTDHDIRIIRAGETLPR